MGSVGMATIDSRYYYEDHDRHGNLRRYFRRRIQGSDKYRKVRLRQEPGTEAFHAEFAAAMAGVPYLPPGAPPPRPEPPRAVINSLRWATEKYMRESIEFRGYDEETRKTRRRILNAICNEPVSDSDRREIGGLPCDIPDDKIRVLVNRKALVSIDSANAWLKALRKFSAWAVTTKPPLVDRNVAEDVPLLQRIETGGHHTWTIEEIETFMLRYPRGTKPHLALMLFLLTGQRLSDVARLGKQFIRRPEHVAPALRAIHPGRWLAFRQHKNRRRNPVDLVIPILPALEDVLAASPLGDLTFLQTEFGKAYTTKGLGNWFGHKCETAGVPGRAHGLRKAGATIAAENGATPHQLMAIFGWRTLEQAETYTKKVRQQMMAGNAMALIGGRFNG
ncbi:tyrosine-type recombinase/integrase [Nitrobacter sp.]|uniref:tyrosine-type recombinase/integrase n=1 Tax=Nitrobacter sp. TaxID=29420 RepID=UPI001DD28813|nr:tyrosine-type recombinase/integrase [Nitrobacter sp.]MCB1394296.1 tyrosine-type recombinase/integrase [Nitrobacter sp.]